MRLETRLYHVFLFFWEFFFARGLYRPAVLRVPGNDGRSLSSLGVLRVAQLTWFFNFFFFLAHG